MSKRVSIHAAHAPRTIVAIHARGAGSDKVTIGFYTGETGRRIPVNTPEWDSAEGLSRYALEAGLPLEKVTVQRERGSLDIWMPCDHQASGMAAHGWSAPIAAAAGCPSLGAPERRMTVAKAGGYLFKPHDPATELPAGIEPARFVQ